MEHNKHKLRIGYMNVRKTIEIKALVALARDLNFDFIVLIDVNTKRKINFPRTILFHSLEKQVYIIQLNTKIKTKQIISANYIVKIKLLESRIEIVGYYYKPKNNADTRATFNYLTNLINNCSPNSLFLGDANAHHESLGDVTNERGDKLMEHIVNAGCCVLNKKDAYTYTHPNGALTFNIDWAITTPSLAGISCWSQEEQFDDFSDHRMNLVEIKSSVAIQSTEMLSINCNKFIRKIREIASVEHIDQWYEHINEALVFATEINKRRRSKGFWTNELETSRKNLNALINYGHNHRNMMSPLKWSEHVTKVKNMTAMHKSLVAKVKSEYYINELKRADDSSIFTSHIKPMKTAKRHHISYVIDNDEIIHDTQKIGELILSKYIPTTRTLVEDLHNFKSEGSPDPPLSPIEICIVIRSRQNKKVPGEDRLSNELIHLWYESDSSYLNALFSFWFDNQIFPHQYKSSLIVPLIKNEKLGPKISNIRCIGLLSHLAKCYEKILANRLYYFFNSFNYFGLEQRGFLPGRGAISALNSIQKIRLRNANSTPKRHEMMVSLDIKAAFDSVTHSSIIKTFVDHKVPCNLVEILKDYFTNRVAKIEFHDAVVTKPMTCGVVQGSTISPLIWAIIIEDTIKTIKKMVTLFADVKVDIIAFADDITLILASKVGYNPIFNAFATIFNNTANHLRHFGLELSPSKTQLLLTYNGPVNIKLKLNDDEISFQKNIKILGVTFSNDRKFLVHIKHRITLAKQKLSQLYWLFKHKTALKRRVREKLIAAIIYPMVTYASSVWYSNDAEVVSALKIFSRFVVISSTRSKYTISHASASIISRLPPLQHYTWKRSSTEIAKNRGRLMNNVEIDLKNNMSTAPHPASLCKLDIFDRIFNTEQVSKLTDEWIAYSDGSLLREGKSSLSVSCAYVIFHNGRETYNEKFKLPSNSSIFAAELFALESAVNYMTSNGHNRFSLVTDSLSALTAIAQELPKFKWANRVKMKIVNLQNNGTVIKLYWAKSHCGIIGNERADELAKEAHKIEQVTDCPISFKNVAKCFTAEMERRINDDYLNNIWGRTMKKFVKNYFDPARTKLIINGYTVQIYSGHINSKQYLHERGLVDSPLCSCGVIQDVIHLITHCTIFVQKNLQIANAAGIPTHILLGDWESLRTHKHLHKYIANRAHTLIAELNELNRKVKNTTELIDEEFISVKRKNDASQLEPHGTKRIRNNGTSSNQDEYHCDAPAQLVNKLGVQTSPVIDSSMEMVNNMQHIRPTTQSQLQPLHHRERLVQTHQATDGEAETHIAHKCTNKRSLMAEEGGESDESQLDHSPSKKPRVLSHPLLEDWLDSD